MILPSIFYPRLNCKTLLLTSMMGTTLIGGFRSNNVEIMDNVQRTAGMLLGIGLLSCSVSWIATTLLRRVSFQLSSSPSSTTRKEGFSSTTTSTPGRLSFVTTAIEFGKRMAALKFMDRYIDDPNDAFDTLTILQTLSSNDTHILELIVQMNGIESTIKAMKNHSESHEAVAVSGCSLLLNLCGYTEKADRILLEHRGITAIVDAMRFWPNNERVQAYACLALDRLASSPNMDITNKIIDVGGLVRLAEARTKHPNDKRVTIPASSAMMKLVAYTK